jgi:hypothetical protein
MNKSDNGCSTKPSEITVQDESVTIVTSKPPAGPHDDTLDGWFDRAQKAREQSHLAPMALASSRSA